MTPASVRPAPMTTTRSPSIGAARLRSPPAPCVIALAAASRRTRYRRTRSSASALRIVHDLHSCILSSDADQGPGRSLNRTCVILSSHGLVPASIRCIEKWQTRRYVRDPASRGTLLHRDSRLRIGGKIIAAAPRTGLEPCVRRCDRRSSTRRRPARRAAARLPSSRASSRRS